MSLVVSKNVLVSIFNRNGEEGRFTRLFDNLSQSEKEDALSKVALESSEEIIISYMESSRWCMISTHRVVWYENNEARTLKHSELLDATFDRKQALLKRASSPFNLQDLMLTTKVSGVISMQVESGKAFSGLWNVLKFIASKNS